MKDAKHSAIDFVRKNSKFFRHDADWFDDNWHIVRAFVDEALALISYGRSHYSARTIVEVMVHHSLTREVEGDFKIGNDNAPYLARIFVFLYPEHANFWESRKEDQKDFLLAVEAFHELQEV